MPVDRSWQNRLSYIYFAASLVGFIGMWIGPFVVSLATGVLILITLPFLPVLWKEYKSWVWFSIAVLGVGTLDLLRDGDMAIVGSKLMLLIGLVFMHLAGLYFVPRMGRRVTSLLIMAAVIVAFINMHTVYTYYSNSDRFDQLLLQSRSIPVINMHHIHFGIINALTIIALIGLVMRQKLEFFEKIGIMALIALVTVSFHILSSRTGLISLYAGVMGMMIAYAVEQGEYRKLIYVTVAAIVLLASSFVLISSFRNKILNSVEDIQSWDKGEEINFKSMGMRLEAYRMSVHIIEDHPLIGVGSGHQHMRMQEEYVKESSVLFPINRVGAHNQLLEFGVKYGIVGILLILAYFLVQFKVIERDAFAFVGVMITLFVAMQFESIFERQTPIYFTAFYASITRFIHRS